MPSENNMTARAWLVKAIGLTTLLVIAAMSIDFAVDLYGIFRNPQSRHLRGYGDDRVAKYLLSERYVPTNFDAILIGSSVSANWNMAKIDGFKVYNESVNGGDIVEEKAIVDRALGSSKIRLAILVVHPFLTSSHEFETVHVTPRENLGALGSQNLLDAYKDKLRERFHRGAPVFDEFGTYPSGDVGREMNQTLKKLMVPAKNFKVDPIALTANEDFVAELHAANIPIVYVVPPMSDLLLESRKEEVDAYSNLILKNKSERDQVIDFTSPNYDDFRRNRGDFSDGVHLTKVGATEIVAQINLRLNDWVRTGHLPSVIDKEALSSK